VSKSAALTFDFLKCYEFLTPNRPEHVSDTCVVMLCRDHNSKEEEDKRKSSSLVITSDIVALKIMKNKDELQKKKVSLVNCTLDITYVVGILSSFDGEADVTVAKELEGKGFKEYKFCIVMRAAERSLQRILLQENVAGKE
jgi:hypothetical protein